MPLDFGPVYKKDENGDVIVVHPTARVRDTAPIFAGQSVEIRGATSDGRRLCVTQSEAQAWLAVGHLMEIK